MKHHGIRGAVWRIASLALIVAAVVIAHAAPSASSTVKITPLTVRVSSSAGQPDGAAATLFDRDTTGDVSIGGPTQIQATLEVPTESGADLDAAMSGPTPPLQGRRYAATPATGTIGALPDETPDDPADNSFHFSVDRSPRDFRRAWIVYETVGVGHWVAAARSINHHATLGGIALTPGQDWSTQIEEIDPDWLQAGDNSVD